MEQYSTLVKSQIQSKLTDEITKLFNLLKKESISGREIKNSILGLSNGVFEFLNKQSNNKQNNINDLQYIEYEIKDSIIDLLLYKSSEIISSEIPLELFMKYMERTNKEIQLINIVFGKVLKEKQMILNIDTYSELSSPFKSFYFKNFVEKILHNNSMTIFSKLIENINKIRYTLNSNETFDKLILIGKEDIDELKSLSDFLYEPEQKEYYFKIHNMISIITDLDFLTENKYNCKYNFELTYRQHLSKIYNVYGSSIQSIKNSRTEYKFMELLKILTIESFIHNSIFNDTNEYKLLIQKELLQPNIQFIQEMFNKKIVNFGEYLTKNYYKSPGTCVSIEKVFQDVLEIPHFVDLYLKIYEYSYEPIKDLCLSLSNEILSFFKSKKREEVTIEFMVLSYIFLKKLEEELVTSFTPSNEDTIESNIDHKRQFIFKNTPFVTDIHNIFLDLIKDIPHNELINIIMLFSQSKFNKKTDSSSSIKNIIENYENEVSLETIKYISFCTKNKDEFEELYKKTLVKKIVLTGLEEYNIDSIEHIINEISRLPDICLQINKTILNSFKVGIDLSNEYNLIYETTKPDYSKSNSKDFLNLTHLPEGISTITPYEYNMDDFLSNSFKKYIKVLKDGFSDYYKFKYDKRLLNWSDNLSTIDLTYNINKFNVNMRVSYRQADLLFLLQYEIDELLEKMTKEEITVEHQLYIEYTNLFNTLSETEFMKFLIEKKMFRKTTSQINDLVSVPIIEINTNMNLRRDKNVDIYKMKFNDLKSSIKSSEKNKPNPKEEDLAFFRSDYVQSFIMKFCKRRKEECVEESELYTVTLNGTKTRFELEKPLFSKSIEKLLKNEYIQKTIIKCKTSTTPEIIGYKYLP
jgi:hypothetical protein